MSADSIAFETPENIELSYRSAGLGTRFIAWFVDRLILAVILFLVFVALLIGGVASDSVLRNFIEPVANELESEESGQDALMYMMGLVVLVLGLGNFFYFGLCELLWRGQTPGKRMSRIRVVKTDGFALDGLSILLRNVFRVLDHLPVLWIVPLLSVRHQRFGDMVAGTIVVQEQLATLGGIRQRLGSRSVSEMMFRIPPSSLSRLTAADFTAIETLLDRWDLLPAVQADQLKTQIATGVANRLKFDLPSDADQLRFLEDVLAAECRRQGRELG